VRAVITGINGQDGRLLSQNLMGLGFDVVGVIRPGGLKLKSHDQKIRIQDLDLANLSKSSEFYSSIKPDFIFHMAAVHAASTGMKETEEKLANSMYECHVEITRNILQWQRLNPGSKSVIALSSQMYQNYADVSRYIDEETIPDSENPYGKSKAAAWDLVCAYRKDYGVLTSGAILFNHASEFSKKEFLFAELADKIIAASKNLSNHISVRNANSFIDITSAREVCEALVKISQLDEPNDFVLGSGKSVPISEIIQSYSKLTGGEFELTSSINGLESKCLVSSIDKANEILNWFPSVRPENLLASIVREKMKVEVDAS